MIKNTKSALAKLEKKRLLAQWSEAVKIRDCYNCQICHVTTHLNSHHILAKYNYKEYALDIKNGICICVSCHIFGKKSFHKNGIWASAWLQKNRPELYELALSRVKEV